MTMMTMMTSIVMTIIRLLLSVKLACGPPVSLLSLPATPVIRLRNCSMTFRALCQSGDNQAPVLEAQRCLQSFLLQAGLYKQGFHGRLPS